MRPAELCYEVENHDPPRRHGWELHHVCGQSVNNIALRWGVDLINPVNPVPAYLADYLSSFRSLIPEWEIDGCTTDLTIRIAKDTGLTNLAPARAAANQLWCALVELALDLTAWCQLLALTDHAARSWDPNVSGSGCSPSRPP